MKYRVYDNVRKKYVTNDYRWIIDVSGKLQNNDYGDLIGIPGCIAEFSSGEFDKRGTEIYEGDVVLIPKYGGGKMKSVVYFKGGKFAVNGSNYSFKDLAGTAYEVIGNIHDENII